MNWVEIDGSNKVTAYHRVERPWPGLLPVLGDPPFTGGTYNATTKKVASIPPGPPPSKRELLAAKPSDEWTLEDLADWMKG